VATADRVFGLVVHPQGWSPEARGVPAGLVALQKSAGGVWWAGAQKGTYRLSGGATHYDARRD